MGRSFILVQCNRETETRTVPSQSTPPLSQLPTSNFLFSYNWFNKTIQTYYFNSSYFIVLKWLEHSSSTRKPLWKECFLFLILLVRTENVSQEPLLYLKQADSLIKMWWRVHLDCTWKFACTVDSNVKKIPALNDTSVPGKVLEWAQLYLQNVSSGYPAYSSQ